MDEDYADRVLTDSELVAKREEPVAGLERGERVVLERRDRRSPNGNSLRSCSQCSLTGSGEAFGCRPCCVDDLGGRRLSADKIFFTGWPPAG